MLSVKVIVARTSGKVALETIELDERKLPDTHILVNRRESRFGNH